MKQVLYLTTTSYPYGTAYCTRIRGIAKALLLLGYKTHVISYFASSLQNEFPSLEDVIDLTTFETLYDCASTVNLIKAPLRMLKLAIKQIRTKKYDFVIVGNCYVEFTRLLQECKKCDVPLILEICEWFDTSKWKLGVSNPFAHIYSKRMNFDYFRSNGIIVISEYLEKHFSKQSDNVIRIPTITDVQSYEYSESRENNRLVLMHNGFSGPYKEQFGDILEAIVELKKIGYLVEYHIYGSSRDDVLINLGNRAHLVDEAAGLLFIHGKVKHIEIMQKLKESSYSVFFRPHKTSSEAGFPTKLAESFIAGTPVICNNTGDISLYLKNEVNGYIVESVQAIIRLLLKLQEQDKTSYIQMRKECRSTALSSFDYGEYVTLIHRFLGVCRNNRNEK